MRLSAAEKYEIIQSATTSDIGVKRTLESFGIHRSTFYKWYQKYLQNGYDGLKQGHRVSRRQWNSIPEEQKDLVVAVALDHTNYPPGNWRTRSPMNKVCSYQNPVSIGY